jgi:hypothetical protein
MIVRSGFVSNSSSSSFILGVGILPDVITQDNNSMLEKLDKKYYYVRVMTKEEILMESIEEYSDYKILDNTLNITGGGNSDPVVSIPMSNNPNTKYLIVTINNDEGDEGFEYNGWEFDYEVAEDISWYNQEQQDLINFIQSLDIKDLKIGAERNG